MQGWLFHSMITIACIGGPIFHFRTLALKYISHAAEIEAAPPPEEQAEPQRNQKNIFSWSKGSQ